jgi:simple sugar transport system ATP-binding protein
MKTVTGMYSADEGEITMNGQSIMELDPGQRRALGIEMIYQDLALAKQQDVASNIFLGREPVKKFLGILPGMVDKRTMDKKAQEMIDRLGAHLPSINRPVGSFSGGQQQTVAIARALTFNPKLVIMDEPTAALAVREVQSVLELIRSLKAEGISVILISHRLNDVLGVTDRIVVLRQGVATANLQTKQTTMNEVVSAIVGGNDMADAAAHELAG